MRRLFLCAVIIAGCSPAKPAQSPSPVSGRVSMPGGQTLEGLVVSFEPITKTPPIPGSASGMIARDGSFSLKTFGIKEGAAPGKYRVVIRASKTSQKATYQVVPVKYRKDDSPLEVDVPRGGKTDFELMLD
jgi:hypothetical protein